MKATPGGESPGNNYIVIVFDSCRYDSFIAAQPKNICKLGDVEARWSYASWTAPSHYNLLSGLLPHISPKRVFASEYYKNDFQKYAERLGDAAVGKALFQPGAPSVAREAAA